MSATHTSRVGGTTLRGLTWDHPRGYAPLDALAACSVWPTAKVVWDRQPLECFESMPLEELCETYDLLVIDHPHLADAVAARGLVPLDGIFDAVELEVWRTQSVGPSYASYSHAGHQWAVPLDAATQVMAARADGPPPGSVTTWEDVSRLAEDGQVALCVGGPHAFLTWTSHLLSAGAELADECHRPGYFVEATRGEESFRFLQQLFDHVDPDVALGNPIEVLEAMTYDPALALCPLVFGYVTYSGRDREQLQAPNAVPLLFSDAPIGTAGRRGSVLGGTGVALSARCANQDQAAVQIRRLMAPENQVDLVPASGGQPSAAKAWESDAVNDAAGDFYRHTRATIDESWVRPRRRGWVHFQDVASSFIRHGLTARRPAREIVAAVNDAYADSVHSVDSVDSVDSLDVAALGQRP